MDVPLPVLESPIDMSGVNISSVSYEWIVQFNAACRSTTPDENVAGLLSADPWWRDQLALTWDLRTFRSFPRILGFLKDTFPVRRPTPFQFIPVGCRFVPMGDKLAFIHASFSFETDVARCSGSVKLVPSPDGEWRAWNIFTRMEEIKGYEEDPARLDVPDYNLSDDLDVVVLGAGQAGLQMSAALRAAGLQNIVIEQNQRIGDHWRRHYDALRLHLSKWTSEFAYRPFPPDMPNYPARDDIANFLETYAASTHLNVVLSTRIRRATFDRSTDKWIVDLMNRDGTSRTLRAGQIVMATGIHGLHPIIPNLKNKDAFKGTVMHSYGFKNGAPWRDKKAIVVGSGTSAHDISEDLYRSGASVTMIQRSPTVIISQTISDAHFGRHYNPRSPPVGIVDRALESTPMLVNRSLSELASRMSGHIDDPLRAGLARAGFLVKGKRDIITAIYERYGGLYINTGCSELIINRKIKVKSGVPISSFTPAGLSFADGSKMSADLIVFATGFDIQSMRKTARAIIGEDEGRWLKEPWGLDHEGELNGVWRDSGHPRLWYIGGDFKPARYHSQLVALQIRATQLGILDRYQG